MGDPRRLRKKYKNPIHPWQAERIEAEKALIKNYGLKNKREIRKMEAVLRKFTEQAKKLIVAKNIQAEKERAIMLKKLYEMGFTQNPNPQLDDALALTLDKILDRRLQSIVYRKGFANTPKKARQMITHGHILVGERKISSPGYLVSRVEEELVTISPDSKFASPDHPERNVQKKGEKKKEAPKNSGEKK
ncbi:MAG: 30S ribosomal protein S4 [Candidatus Woesearchaeota archaeon]